MPIFDNHVRFQRNEAQDLRLQRLTAAPDSPQESLFYFDVTVGLPGIYVGTPGAGGRWVYLSDSAIADNSITSAKIANGTIVDADIAAAAAIALTKLATDPLARANHTGTQAAATISDFDTRVRTTRPDQMATMTAALNFGAQRGINAADPTGETDLVTKRYADQLRAGLRLKDAVRAATTATITLSGAQTVDGVALIAGDRALVKHGTDQGIYLVAAGAWTRAADADTFGELQDGATTFVQEGTTQANTTWTQINTLTALTTSQSWLQQGAAAAYLGGAGMTLDAQTFNVGQGTGVIVGADTVAVDTAVVVRKYAAAIGDGTATSYTVTHNLATRDITVGLYQATTPWAEVITDVEHTDINTVTLRFASAPTAGKYRVVVHG